ncbi:MAG: ISL3 family transposase [Gemmatimonadota bacterium]|nr:ISL3 family transposase [Gemmatimonadota bacterium]
MSREELTALLGGWEGYTLGTVGRVAVGPEGGRREEIHLELLPVRDQARVCSGCGKVCRSIHDTAERWIDDLPVLGADTRLLVHRVRVACPDCGPKVERLDLLEPYARVTVRLAQNVARLCRVLPVKHVADYFRLDWKTVKAIDKAYLNRTLGPVELDGVTKLAMDEFAIQKGHRYATVVIDPTCKRVLWVGRGRSREEVRPFFELLGPARCKQIVAVAMDMNAAYDLEVRAHCPNAEVVYDLFHVVAKYGREVVDRVRVDEANRVKDDKPARKVIKGSRWLLLKNADNITKETDRVRLAELLKANRKLAAVYLLKDDLKELWDYRHTGYAQRFWDGWYARAIRSRIEPLKAFARKLKGYLPGILSHCRFPLHTSVLEGINNKIKVIKRMAYGFRDDAYFFLKIRQAFPGVGR